MTGKADDSISGPGPSDDQSPTLSSPTQPAGQGGMPTISRPKAAANDAAPEAAPAIEGYEITGRLGQGGMGVVWRAVQLGTHREVPLKLMSGGPFASDKALRRFEREVELAASLEQTVSFTMELLHGIPRMDLS